ncbi:MAG: hypothetical protein JNK65_04125 [Deltaproteobacteria bacterium]|nr:hypothetical protein [Deltaproteobacteria bacterium]
MKKSAVLLFLTFFIVSHVFASTSVKEKDLKTTPATESRAQTLPESHSSETKKDPIDHVGDAFKTAGRGIKKGVFATGRAFKKVGKSIKNTFSDSNSKKTKDLDKVGEDSPSADKKQ